METVWRNGLLAAIIFLLLFPACSYGYVKWSGFCQNGGGLVPATLKLMMQSFPGCTVTVYQSGTLTLASIYSDNSGTAKSNPFTADSATGYFFFFAASSLTASSRYDVRLSGAGMSPYTIGSVLLLDPTDIPGVGVPYQASVVGLTTLTVLASTHGQGLTPIAYCFDNATPPHNLPCAYTRDASGNIVFDWSGYEWAPGFNGTVEIHR